MRKLIVALMLFSVAHAQDWNTNSIADSLLKDANAVKRFEEFRLSFRDKGHAVVKHHVAISILNEAGEKYSSYFNYYDKYRSLSDITGTLYDASGKKLRTIKKKDISDESYADGMSIANDTRTRSFNFYHRIYPYTVEFEDEVELKGLFFIDDFQPAAGFAMSVQKSNLVITAPADFSFESKSIGFDQKPVVSEERDKKIYSWSISGLTAKTHQPYQPAFSDVTPTVLIKANDFEIGGYSGNMSNWQSLGKFIQELNKGRDVLPDNIKKTVHELTDGVADRTEKIKILYDYLQKNSRYILVALGMGGWQPFDAAYVAQNKFGDCKALSNFMVSLLKEAGIPSYYALIRAGDDESPIKEDFPLPHFNHATVCVPNGRDSVWLECTDQTKSAGYQGTFTGNRKALLITENGGKLVATKQYNYNDNLAARKVVAEISEEGHLKADAITLYKAIQQEQIHELIHYATEKEKKEYLNATIDLPTYEVLHSEYSEKKDFIPEIVEKLTITAPHYASVSGSRLFITPNLFNKTNVKLAADENRTVPLIISLDYTDIDTVTIKVPAGYTVESKPKDVLIESSFGKYSILFNVEGNVITMIRKNELYRKDYPASSYNSFVDYKNKIYKADRGQVVLKKS